MHLILCGLTLSGKSSCGLQAAKCLARCFVDTDELIETDYALKTGLQCSCRQICQTNGEKAFRTFERNQLIELKTKPPSVVALGGGSLHTGDNVEWICSLGKLIYLKTPLERIWGRIQKKGIPAYLDAQYPKQSFYAMAGRRLPLYELAAHTIIDTTNKSKKKIIEEIVSYGK